MISKIFRAVGRTVGPLLLWSKSLLSASPPFVKTYHDRSLPTHELKFGERLLGAAVLASLPLQSGTPEKLILNEVMFGASIKNEMPGDQSTIFILEICCNHQEIQVSRPNVSSVTQSPAPGKSVWLLCHNVKKHQRLSVLQKCAAGREGVSPPGPGAPQTARGLRGAGVSSKRYPLGCEFTGGKI